MRRRAIIVAVALALGWPAGARTPAAPPPDRQIAAALLPLPEIMRVGAAVLGYAPDMSLVTLRRGSNGMVCTATRPNDAVFDVRCYAEAFMPVVRRARELYARGLKQDEVVHIIDDDVRAGRLTLPDHPTAGYRMLGPMSSYHPATNTVGKEIEAWQSVHFPYRTAAEIGLPVEGQVDRAMPYVMASGTFWSHVMIEHDTEPGRK